MCFDQNLNSDLLRFTVLLLSYSHSLSISLSHHHLIQPATIKTHNIIERTASFVCQQGAQFEIVLKAKQAANSQFDFLRFDHYLNPYYKHVLRAMKEGRYSVTTPSGAASGGDQQQGESESEFTVKTSGEKNSIHTFVQLSSTSFLLLSLLTPLFLHCSSPYLPPLTNLPSSSRFQ